MGVCLRQREKGRERETAHTRPCIKTGTRGLDRKPAVPSRQEGEGGQKQSAKPPTCMGRCLADGCFGSKRVLLSADADKRPETPLGASIITIRRDTFLERVINVSPAPPRKLRKLS